MKMKKLPGQAHRARRTAPKANLRLRMPALVAAHYLQSQPRHAAGIWRWAECYSHTESSEFSEELIAACSSTWRGGKIGDAL
jgi:hypothetical protein